MTEERSPQTPPCRCALIRASVSLRPGYAGVVGGKRLLPTQDPRWVCVFPTGRNWARGKHAVAAETIWTVSLFPTHPNNQPSGIARGTKALLRPWQLLFPPAKGAEPLLRPWQTAFLPARGAGALLCPWQLLFPPARGTAPPFCPWQLLFLPARGTKTLSCPPAATVFFS